MTVDARDLLRSPDTWCEGARLLAEAGATEAIPDIVRAYEQRAEGGRVCLLDALDALGAVDGAAVLLASSDPEERRLGAHLAEIVPDEGHLKALEPAACDPDPVVANAAGKALRSQRRTAAWEAVMLRLRGSADPGARQLAEECLAGRRLS